MKATRIYTLLALLLMVGGVTMQAQEYVPMIQEGNEWHTLYWGMSPLHKYNYVYSCCKWQIKNQQFFVINFHQFFVISFHQFWIVLRKSAVEAEAA